MAYIEEHGIRQLGRHDVLVVYGGDPPEDDYDARALVALNINLGGQTATWQLADKKVADSTTWTDAPDWLTVTVHLGNEMPAQLSGARKRYVDLLTALNAAQMIDASSLHRI
ncbi:MAG: hypothetical protein JHC84_02105 [Solirubrobacteraceae bacterium]|nr:hypothetical protein [Solirubrobacteraceae bacterium]